MPVYFTSDKMTFNCEMCGEQQLRRPMYIWVSIMKKETGTPDMRICRKCAIREHGKKNKRKIEDKDDGKS